MGAPTRVLAVRSGADHVDEAAAALEREGVTVIGVESAEEALSELGAVDCVVVPERLPDGDGLELADAIAQRASPPPVVLAPADGDETLAGRAVGTGVSEYVPDGTDPEAVVAAVTDSTTAPAAGDGGTVGRYGDEVSFDLKERAMDAAPVGITLTDPSREDNPLVYVNDSFESMTGYSRAEVIGDNCRFLQGPDTDEAAVTEIREAVDTREPITIELKNYTKEDEPFWNRLDIAPIRQDGEVTHFVGFQSDSTERKRAEEAAQRRADQLAHLLDRIDGLLSEATTALIAAESRSDVERSITELLADTDPYLGAWIATRDYTTDRLTPGAAVGIDESVLDPVEERLPSAPSDAVTTDGAVQCVRVDELPSGPRRDAAPDGAATLVVIPLTYGDTSYGVVNLYAPEDATANPDRSSFDDADDADENDLLDEREVAILGSLGEMVGAGINAAETKRIIASTEIVRLAFDAADGDLFFVALSAGTGARLEHVGSSFAGDEPRLSFTITGTSAEAIESFVADTESLVGADVVAETESELLVEFELATPGIVSLFADNGAECRSIVVEDGVARLEVEAPQGNAARQLVDAVTERYPETSLAAYRESKRAERTRPEFAATLREQLTDRQYTALQRAHASDFFEWPRPVSGGELADSMGISRPTFHQHLRASLRKLVTGFFEGTDPDDRG